VVVKGFNVNVIMLFWFTMLSFAVYAMQALLLKSSSRFKFHAAYFYGSIRCVLHSLSWYVKITINLVSRK
jgi:NADH:ubiquinone oxidoreductase subunit H